MGTVYRNFFESKSKGFQLSEPAGTTELDLMNFEHDLEVLGDPKRLAEGKRERRERREREREKEERGKGGRKKGGDGFY